MLGTSGDIPYTWFTFISPVSDTVTPGGSNTVLYSINTAGLTLDETYTGTITVASNDPDENPAVINFELLAGWGNPSPFIENLTTQISGDTLTLNWECWPPGNYSHIYSSDDPFGTFTKVHTTTGLTWSDIISTVKKFYYITASYTETPAPQKNIVIEDTNSTKKSQSKNREVLR